MFNRPEVGFGETTISLTTSSIRTLLTTVRIAISVVSILLQETIRHLNPELFNKEVIPERATESVVVPE